MFDTELRIRGPVGILPAVPEIEVAEGEAGVADAVADGAVL